MSRAMLPFSVGVITPPIARAVPLDVLKTFLRVTHDVEDDLLLLLMGAAVQRAELVTRRQLLQATLTLTLPAWPGACAPVELRRPPLQAVTEVRYVDPDGVSQALDPALYEVANYSATMPAYLTPAHGGVWPAVRPGLRNGLGAVTITYVAGWPQTEDPAQPGVFHADLPGAIKTWLLMRVKDLYEVRGGMVVENRALQVEVLPHAFMDGLLDPWIVPEAL